MASCNVIASIIVIVVAVVVTYFTSGATAEYFGSMFVGGFMGGVAGSVVSQTVGMAVGTHSNLSWSDAFASGVAGGVTYGMAGNMSTTMDSAQSVGGVYRGLDAGQKAMIAGAGVAANAGAKKLVGKPSGFKWSNVAAAMGTSYIGDQMGASDPGNSMAVGAGESNFGLDVASGIARSGISYGIRRGLGDDSASWNFRDVAVDAFGNALGNSIVRAMQPKAVPSKPQQTLDPSARFDVERAFRANQGYGSGDSGGGFGAGGSGGGEGTGAVDLNQFMTDGRVDFDKVDAYVLSTGESVNVLGSGDSYTGINIGGVDYDLPTNSDYLAEVYSRAALDAVDAPTSLALAASLPQYAMPERLPGEVDTSYLALAGEFFGGFGEGVSETFNSTGRYIGNQLYTAVHNGFYETDLGRWANRTGNALGDESYRLARGYYGGSRTARAVSHAAGFGQYLQKNFSAKMVRENLNYSARLAGDYAGRVRNRAGAYYGSTTSMQRAGDYGHAGGSFGANMAMASVLPIAGRAKVLRREDGPGVHVEVAGKTTATSADPDLVNATMGPNDGPQLLQLSSYKDRIDQTPISGTWSGVRGESYFYSDKPEVTEYYTGGIKYTDGYVDLSPITVHEVRIGKIGTHRPSNFNNADQVLADKLEVKRQEITKMRKREKLTWHEVEDMRTMQLVPTMPHSKLGHMGGVGEAKRLEAYIQSLREGK